MPYKKIFHVVIFILSAYISDAQDSSLLKMLNDSMAVNMKRTYVSSTFKATHVINMQTVEAPAAGALSFVIQHRFGQLNSGAYNFFGLDNATLRLGFDYGITDRLAVGVGRSSFQKTFDGYLKYKLLAQTANDNQVPVTVSALGTVSYFTLNEPGEEFLNATYRTAYTAQLLIARKFNRYFSLQVAPTYLHYNIVPTVNDKNNEFAIGAGARMKITKRMSIDAEYNYLFPNQVVSMDVHNSFSLGWDIETGGHVFQLVFTNSQAINESQYIGRTTSSWSDGGIYFGFNISRDFNITNHAKHKTAF